MDELGADERKLIVPGLFPRVSVELELCAENDIDFIDHIDGFLLASGELPDTYFQTDKTHLNMSGLTKHFNQNNILYDLQHGFRERWSCETQLLQLIEDLARNMTEGKQTDHILLDFSKAFDNLNHLKLLYKLKEHGVRGKTLGWIESFLVGRSQIVVLDGESSDELPVLSGVLQGPRDQFWVPSCCCFILTTCQKMFNHRYIYLQMKLQFI